MQGWCSAATPSAVNVSNCGSLEETALAGSTDAVAQMVVSATEDDANDQENGRVVVDGTTWKSAGTFTKTSGRAVRSSQRNGPTRCFHDERRGVIGGLFTQDLGRAVVLGVAQMLADKASELLEAATGYPVSSATMKRTTLAVGNAVRDEEEELLAAVIDKQLIDAAATTVAISVDALSFRVREQRYKQACVATISLLESFRLAKQEHSWLRCIRFERVGDGQPTCPHRIAGGPVDEVLATAKQPRRPGELKRRQASRDLFAARPRAHDVHQVRSECSIGNDMQP